ncbi:hypothetical protein RFI_31012 [Reticulomyxa filosa]|uniref:Uncharacterized protein n=1 Tax=Reticulomyxa filosa TaxID=46433 RepID=X6M0A8_RETFI|nr:hypothetical protein RFI_31012 [Reticulomyxa filosa]|eukprot:ETO06385.1 hypothetical protein RFI_31012 [Reticulomyxa filosa]
MAQRPEKSTKEVENATHSSKTSAQPPQETEETKTSELSPKEKESPRYAPDEPEWTISSQKPGLTTMEEDQRKRLSNSIEPQLLKYFYDRCFQSKPQFIAKTLQGYVCKAKKKDDKDLKKISDTENWSSEKMNKVKEWPDTVCVKASLKCLVMNGLSLEKKPVTENIMREMHVLRKLSCLSTCPP